MLVTFRSTESGQIQMFGEAATDLLKMMGTHGEPKGALSAADIPAAVAALEQALKTVPPPPEPEQGANDEKDPPVGLRQRAVPLIDFLRRSAAGNAPVQWDHT